MLVLNFAHPLSETATRQLSEALLNAPIDERRIPVQLDLTAPLAPQIVAAVDACDLDPTQWQLTPFLLNLPGMSVAAALVLAEIHGRCGFFPRILRLVQIGGTFELAELIDLSIVRAAARQRR